MTASDIAATRPLARTHVESRATSTTARAEEWGPIRPTARQGGSKRLPRRRRRAERRRPQSAWVLAAVIHRPRQLVRRRKGHQLGRGGFVRSRGLTDRSLSRKVPWPLTAATHCRANHRPVAGSASVEAEGSSPPPVPEPAGEKPSMSLGQDTTRGRVPPMGTALRGVMWSVASD